MKDSSRTYRLSPHHHVIKYSKILWVTLQSPSLIFFIIIGNFFLALCLGFFYHFELGTNPNVNTLADVIWWGFSTVSTVGYGDIVPVTWQGRLSGIFLMILGVSFFIGFTSIWVTTFLTKLAEVTPIKETPYSKNHQELMSKLQSIEERLQSLENKQT